MLGCGKFLSVGGEFVVQQVVELLWVRPLVVLYNMSVAGVRVVEFGTNVVTSSLLQDESTTMVIENLSLGSLANCNPVSRSRKWSLLLVSILLHHTHSCFSLTSTFLRPVTKVNFVASQLVEIVAAVFYTGRRSFLSPNQQRQSTLIATEGWFFSAATHVIGPIVAEAFCILLSVFYQPCLSRRNFTMTQSWTWVGSIHGSGRVGSICVGLCGSPSIIQNVTLSVIVKFSQLIELL